MNAIADLLGHIEAIADRHEIAIEWSDDGTAWAMRDADLIRIPPIRSQRAYAIALHELGHMLGLGQDIGVIASERGAWTWARNSALAWTPAMEREQDRCMAWYRKHRAKAHAKWKAARSGFASDIKAIQQHTCPLHSGVIV